METNSVTGEISREEATKMKFTLWLILMANFQTRVTGTEETVAPEKMKK